VTPTLDLDTLTLQKGARMSAQVHIAGPSITIEGLRRTRCGWCGALIHEHNVPRHSPLPAPWRGLVQVDHGMVTPFHGSVRDPRVCIQIPAEVTR
jgi:hypothetical protein